MGKKRIIQMNFVLALVLVITGTLFWCAYKWDNKYTRQDTQPYVLADNWEYYTGQLYEPEDFTEGRDIITPEIIFIGQFGTFAREGTSSSPFGKATYRKVFRLQDSEEGWLLELPEIYSVCKVFVNGHLVRSYGAGQDANYKPHVQNTLISLPSGNVELVIQAVNYTHYYSGLTYPPLLGESSFILGTVTAQFIFYGVLCFFSLGCAAAFLALWISRGKEPFSMAYGLLCLFFAVRISYPFWSWLGIGIGELLYVVEDTAYFAMVFCMVRITGSLTAKILPPWSLKAAYIITGGMLLLPSVMSFFFLPSFGHLVAVYGKLIGYFKIIISIYLIGAGAAALYREKEPVWLLGGNAVFGMGIAADYITAGKFDPARFGWLDEYSGFFMVLLFTALMVRNGKCLMQENKTLTENLQSEVNKKTEHLQKMLEERKQFLAAAAHDLKAPTSVIQTYIDYIRISGIEIDHEMEHYLSVINNKSEQIRENLETLQQFNAGDGIKEPCEFVDCNEFLKYVYEETLPYADANGIYYELKLPERSRQIHVRKEQFFRVLENIVLNSVEHTQVYGRITMEAVSKKGCLEIKIADTGEGISKEILPHIFDYQFSTKSHQGIRGLGLYFAKKAVEEHGGTITADSEEGRYTVFTIIIPGNNHLK